jgi:hypothetical protein
MRPIQQNKTVWIAFADIKKAYDNVSLDSLDTFMKEYCSEEYVLEEWKNELSDMRMLNMDINGEILYRTKGLPQGSELAPLLFNFYLTRIMAEIRFETEIEYYAYADNMVVIGTSREDVIMAVDHINSKLCYYGMEFDTEEVELIEFNKFAHGFFLFPNDLEYGTEEKVTFLGGKWSILNKALYFDFQDFQFKLPKYFPQPGFEAIKYAKKFIIPKYRFYYSYLKHVDKLQIPNYKNWFYKEFKIWLQKSCIFQNISIEFIDELILPNKVNKNFGKFITTQLAYLKEIPIRKINQKQITLLDRLSLISKMVFNRQLKIGIYKAVNMLMKENLNIADFQGMSKGNMKEQRRTWMVLDLLYFGIMNERRFSSLQFNEQQKYNWKSLRKSVTWPFF